MTDEATSARLASTIGDLIEQLRSPDVLVGWRAVREYSGATFGEIADAIAAGELRCQIRVRRNHLQNWIDSVGSKSSLARVVDQAV